MLVQMETGQLLTMPSREIKKIEPSNSLILKIGTKQFSFVLENPVDKDIIDFYDVNFDNPLNENEIAKELELSLIHI